MKQLVLVKNYLDPGDSVQDAVVNGDLAYVAEASRLMIYNVSDVFNAKLISSTYSLYNAEQLKIVGNTLYMIQGLQGINRDLKIFNVTDPTTPTLLSSINTIPYSYDVEDDYLYVGDFTKLEIYDIKEKSSPILQSDFTWWGAASRPYGVTVVNNVCHIAWDELGTVLVDVSIPTLPIVIGSYNPGNQAKLLSYANNLAYVVDSNSDLQIIDPKRVSDTTLHYFHITIPETTTGIKIVDEIAYVATGTEFLIMNITNPETPVLLSNSTTIVPNPANIYIVDDLVYLGGSSGVKPINISDPANPVPLATVATALGTKVVVNNDIAYFYGGTTITAIDVSVPNTYPRLGIYLLPAYNPGVDIIDNTLYVANFNEGFRILDASYIPQIDMGGVTLGSGFANSVTVVNNIAYFGGAGTGNGLKVVNVTEPASPTIIGTYNTSGLAYNVEIIDDYAYLAVNPSSFTILNITDPTSPSFVGHYNSLSSPRSSYVDIDTDIAYVADNTDGLVLLNITDRTTPSLLSISATPGNANDVFVQDDLAYVADTTSLQIFNISNSTMPTFVGSYLSLDLANTVQVFDDIAYVSASGLRIFNVTNPSNPILVSSYTNGVSFSRNFEIHDTQVYLTDQNRGVTVIDIANLTAPIFKTRYEQISGMPVTAQDITVANGVGYIASGADDENMKMFNATALSAVEQGWYQTTGDAIDVKVDGDHAFVACTTGGLNIFDVSNSSNPVFISAYTENSIQAIKVEIENNIAYVADKSYAPDSGILLLDVSNVTAPSLIDSYSVGGQATNMAIGTDVVFFSTTKIGPLGASGLHILNKTALLNSTEINPKVGEYNNFNNIAGLRVNNANAYISNYDSGTALSIVDISNPAAINPIASIATIISTDFDVTDDYIYVPGGGSFGFSIFRLDTPPQLVNNSLLISTEGESVPITSHELDGFDPEESDDELTVDISELSHGQFERVSNSSATTSFTLRNIKEGDIRFIHDGSYFPPSYKASINDKYITTLPLLAQVNFTSSNVAPIVNQAITKQTVVQNEPFNFQIDPNAVFYDANNDTLTLSAEENGLPLPSFIQFDDVSNTFSGLLSGPELHNITVTAMDPGLLNVSTSFELVSVPPSGGNGSGDNGLLGLGMDDSAVYGIGGGIVAVLLTSAACCFWSKRKRKKQHQKKKQTEEKLEMENITDVTNQPNFTV